MSQTQRHYGFAQVPRLVLRGDKFKDLTLIEKGLYASLKDICGDDGECFYTFRNLAKEIHTSISTLSRYIPKLVKAGLITAEKKIRSVNKHEVFHIRIVNIWEENDTLYRPLDSKNGFTEKQIIVSDRNNSDVDTKIVASRNNSVSDRNKDNGTQAQDCFYLNDRIRSNNNNLNEEDLYVNASALTRTPSSENETSSHSPQASDDPLHGPLFQAAGMFEREASEQLHIANPTPHTDTLVDVPIGNAPSLVEVVPQVVTPTRQRGSRRRKVERDDVTQKRIEAVYEAMDAFKQKVMNDPTAKFQRDMTADDEIEKMLALKPTYKKLLKVCYDMWNEKDERTGMCFWRKHMKPKNIAKEYETRIMALEGGDSPAKDPEGEQDTASKVSAAVAAGYTDYTNTPPTNYKPLPRKRA